MVPLQYKFAGEHTHAPANERRKRFNGAENKAGAQCFRKFGFMQGGAFAN